MSLDRLSRTRERACGRSYVVMIKEMEVAVIEIYVSSLNRKILIRLYNHLKLTR